MALSRALRRIAYSLLPFYWRVFRPITLGSRTLVIKNREILLVKLTYHKGWLLPGGGVDRGESFLAAASRELAEECGIKAHSLSLFGLYFTEQQRKRDHVAVYVIEDFSHLAKHKPDPEIAEARFFPLESLPSDVTPATRRRVDEYLQRREKNSQW